jgi:tRNA modification GTPase
MVATSAMTGQGLAELKSAIRRSFAPEGSLTEGLDWLPSLRQEESLARTRKDLERAARALWAGYPPEVVAVDLRSGLERLGELTGESVGEAVLETIFSRFCVGK